MNHRTLKPPQLILIATTVLLVAVLPSPVSRSSPASSAMQDSANPIGGVSEEAGAVPLEAAVAIINLSAHNLITATAEIPGWLL